MMEIVGGLAFIQDPEKLEKLFKPLGIEPRTVDVHHAQNIKTVLG